VLYPYPLSPLLRRPCQTVKRPPLMIDRLELRSPAGLNYMPRLAASLIIIIDRV